MIKAYDYIITGAGCAGLSMLMRILNEPTLNTKKILVIDEQPKKDNDRTWCFWEKENDIFQSIVHHEWREINFLSPNYSAQLSIEPYTYKMIHGLDFYTHIINYAKGFASVEFIYEKVLSIKNESNKAVVTTTNTIYEGEYIFNSILFAKPKINSKQFYLLQHFKGWVIETEKPVFNPAIATFMDFTVSQQHGTTFMYVLPTTSNKALVEYTLFTETLLQKQDYETALQQYITKTLGIEKFTITHTEFGIIPMTNYKFPLQEGNIINIGIAGGQAKGSSGYVFKNIQKRTTQIVELLVKNKQPFFTKNFTGKKFHLYDSVLLHVLHHKKMSGDAVFASIFKKNKSEIIFKFLDNESTLLEDVKIMRSVPMHIFLPTAIKEMFR